jgi:signal transduction histidine kinase
VATTRIEKDSMGAMEVPADAYYGAQTRRAELNFPISPLRMPRPMIRAMGLIKKAAAQVNMDLKLLPPELGAAIVQADVIAQQQEALDQLRDLARMREELIANVSHELRTPLAAILGSVKTLRRDGIGATERAQLVEMLDAQTERLSLLAEDLLDLSRFRKGTQSLTYGTIAFSQLVARARDGIEIPGAAISASGSTATRAFTSTSTACVRCWRT